MRRPTVFTLAVAAVCMCGPVLASGETLYVSKSGSDWATPCTAAEPCATITRALWIAEPGDTIHVGPGQFHEPYGLTITKNVTIQGSGSLLGTAVRASVKGKPVFDIHPGVTASVSHMTIYGASGGRAGGIDNSGALTLSDAWIYKNSATDVPGGGAILNTGWLTLLRVGVEFNHGATAILNSGTAAIDQSWIRNNQGLSSTDGIANAGTLTLDRSLIEANQGAGVTAWNPSGPSAPGGPTTVLTNVTISGNWNGGVRARGGTTTLTHVTIANNKVSSGTSGLSVTGGRVSLRNSIIANNDGVQCAIQFDGWVDGTHSLIGEPACLSPVWPDASILIGVDPKLAGLSNTNYLRTHALLSGSPAIDAATPLHCTSTDQRGTERPKDGDGDGTSACDMGAFEHVPPVRRSGRPIRR